MGDVCFQMGNKLLSYIVNGTDILEILGVPGNWYILVDCQSQL